MEIIFHDVDEEVENRIGNMADIFNREENAVHDRNEEIKRRFASMEDRCIRNENATRILNEENERRFGRLEHRFSKTEEAVKILQTQVSALNAAVERALSSLLPKVESLLRRDVSAKVSGASTSSPSTSSSCQRTLSSHSQGEPLQKAHTSAQEEPKPTTPMSEASPLSDPRVTSVSEAAAAGDAVALRRILANGGDANQRDANGVPALHLAAAGGHVQALEALLDGGARNDLEDPGKRTALHIATAKGHLNVVLRLLEAESLMVLKAPRRNFLLKLAVNCKNWQIVHLLLKEGSDPNARVFMGNSALMVAAEEGEIKIVKVMLRNMKPKNVWPALSYAKNASVVQAFEEALPGIIMEKGDRAMREAAAAGRLESMVALLDVGVDINCYNQFRMTALIVASSNGKVECVNALVRRGACLNGADCCIEHTALHWASMYGHNDVVRVLLDAGADATKRDWRGKTALECASTDAIKRALSSLLPKVESLLRRDVSVTVSGAATSSCQRTLSSHSQEEPLQKAHTSAQEEPKATTSMGEVSSVSDPRVTSVSEAAAAEGHR